MFQKLLGKPKVTSYDNNTSTIPLTNDQKMRIFNDTKVMYENSKLKLALTLPFSRQELTRIKRRFASILAPSSMTLSWNELMKMPELRHVPLLQKVLECIIRSQSSSAVLLLSPTGGENPLATDNSKHQEAQIVDLSITFEHFLSLLSVFSVKQSIIEKRKVLFDVYDNDKNGFISYEEFIQVFNVISGIQSTPETKDKIYQEIQSKWTLWAKANPTKGLNMTEFQQLLTDDEVFLCLSIQY